LCLTRGINSVINKHCGCNTYFWVLQQQCLFIIELIPRVRPQSTYYNNNVYLSQRWYHESDTKVRITTTMLLGLTRGINSVINRNCCCNTYFCVWHVVSTLWVYLLQSWYHVSDPKVRITTTMSIYDRVDTTCQSQKYVLQQQLMYIDHRVDTTCQ
jgi:hypothetical protein